MKTLREYIELIENTEQKKPIKTHTPNCGHNYGHDCDCEGTLTHASDCAYRYGHDCDCGLDREQVETFDGCWEDYDFDECDDDTKEFIEEFLIDNSVYDLEEEGWSCGDTEMIIDCDLIIERVEE